MDKYITLIEVSLNHADEEQLKGNKYDQINVNLNTEGKGPAIYLWYKKGNKAPISRIQVSFTNEMSSGLINAGYQTTKDLNGGKGNAIYLWYYSGSTGYDTPIVDLSITANAADEAPKYQIGWERVGFDLSRCAGGSYIYAWVKRENPTYICDVVATSSFGSDVDLFKQGYTRVDEDLNCGAGGVLVFIWYRQTTSTQKALTDLKISNNDQTYQSWQNQRYKIVDVNLNEGNDGSQVYLWSKINAALEPIQALSVLINAAAVDPYTKAGIQVIKTNLNSGNNGPIQYLAYYQ